MDMEENESANEAETEWRRVSEAHAPVLGIIP